MEKEGRKLKDWILENLERKQIQDIATFGIEAGWSGLAAYADTSRLYAEFKHEIWESLFEEAKALGFGNPIELIASGFDQEALDRLETIDQFENLLFWHLFDKRIMEIVSEKSRS